MSVPSSPHHKHKQLECKVLLLDDIMQTFCVPTKSVGSVLFNDVVHKLQLLESDYFDLEYTDLQGIACWLDHDKPILRQLPSHNLVFRFVVKFYSPDPVRLEEEYTRYLFALQIKRDLASGALSCQEHTAVLLASYVVQAVLGDFSDHATLDCCYLRDLKLVPNQTDQLEKKIAEQHREHAGQTPADADFNLLDTARKVDLYGIHMHPAKDHENTVLQLAVAHMGLLVFQNQTKINTFSWPKIRKLSFKRKKFLIKLHPEGCGYLKDVVEFYFETRNECKTFWKRCLEHHSFFRCDSVKRPTRNKTPFLSRGSSFRYSGRTQKEVVEYARDNFVKRPPFQRSTSLKTISTIYHTSSTPKMSTLNSRDMHLARHPNAFGSNPNSVTVDRKVLSITKNKSGENATIGSPVDKLQPSHTSSLQSFRLHPEGRAESLLMIDSSEPPDVKITSLSETKTGALDDFNCSYYTNKTNELDFVCAVNVCRGKSVARSRTCDLIKNASYYHDVMSQGSYHLINHSQGSLTGDPPHQNGSKNSSVKQLLDEVHVCSNEENGCKFNDMLNNALQCVQAQACDVQLDRLDNALQPVDGQACDVHLDHHMQRVRVQDCEEPLDHLVRDKPLCRSDVRISKLIDSEDCVQTVCGAKFQSTINVENENDASLVSECDIERDKNCIFGKVEQQESDNSVVKLMKNINNDSDANVSLICAKSMLEIEDEENRVTEIGGVFLNTSVITVELNNESFVDEGKLEPKIINGKIEEVSLKLLSASENKPHDNPSGAESDCVGSIIDKMPENGTAIIPLDHVPNDFEISSGITSCGIYEYKLPTNIDNNSDDIPYTLHKRHLVSAVGQLIDNKFKDKSRYGVPAYSIHRSRSHSPCQSRFFSHPVSREQRKLVMENVKTNLKSTNNLTNRIPSSSVSMQAVFAVYNKLPRRDSFSSRDDSISPPFQRKLVNNLQAKVNEPLKCATFQNRENGLDNNEKDLNAEKM